MDPVLLLTADAVLLDQLLRLTAAAGVAPDVVDDPARALAGWATAPLVVVGVDQAAELRDLRPGRRGGVHLATDGPAPPEAFEHAVAIGAESVVELPDGEAWLVEALTDVGDDVRRASTVVGVVGGSGGAGATTFACALAQVAASSADVLVVDADDQGPGADLVLGLDDVDGVRWDSLAHASGRLSARALREVVPRRDRLGVLGWPAGPAADPPDPVAVREALSAASRGHDLVVLDLPRASTALVDELVSRCHRLLVVVVATTSGVAAASRVAARLARHRDVGLVVRVGPLDPVDVEAAIGRPVVAVMRDQRRLDEAVDLGLGPARRRRGPLATAAREALAA